MKRNAITFALSAAFALIASGCQPLQTADTLMHNGRIYTADTQRTIASALAIKDGEILFVGSNTDAEKLIGTDTKIIDLKGSLVLPGLHDTHIHPTAIIEYDDCNLKAEAMDLADLSDFVAACIQRLAVPEGQWVTVKQWAFGGANKPQNGLTTLRHALDKASQNHPIILLGNDGHHNATNSAGLARAVSRSGQAIGLSNTTLQTEFAELKPFVGVDSAGEPDGAINEHVHEILGAPWVLTADLDLKTDNADQIPKRLASLGITSILEAAYTNELRDIYDTLSDAPLRIRLASLLSTRVYQDEKGRVNFDALMADAESIRNHFQQHPNIKADILKYFVDGVLEGNPLASPPTLPNAAMVHDYHQPIFKLNPETGQVQLNGYVDPQGEICRSLPENQAGAEFIAVFQSRYGFHPDQCKTGNGVMMAPRETTLAFAQAAQEKDFSVHFHAIGDRAVRTALDAIEALPTSSNGHSRHSMTHIQLIQDDDIERLGRLKVPVAFTYGWANRTRDYETTVVPFIEKLDSLEGMYNPQSYYYSNVYPTKAIRDAGGILAAGSDAPVETENPRPFYNVAMAVTRDIGEGPMNPEQRINIYDAIDAYTINGARLLDQDAVTGSLETGKKADLIVINQDIIRLAEEGNPQAISATRVLQTWFEGKLVYSDAQQLAQH